MKFSIGDIVVLNRTGEEGRVTAYVDNEIVEVEVNGVAFPVYLDEIDHPYLKWFTEKKQKKVKRSLPEQLPVEKPKLRIPRLARGVYISFLPVFKTDEIDDVVEDLKIHLLNELPQSIHFKYDIKVDNQTIFRHEGKLHGFGNLYLHTLPFADMNDQPRFHWQLTDADNPANGVEIGILRIKPSRLFEHINELMQKNEPAFSYALIEDFKPKPKEEKPERFESVTAPKFITKANATAITESPKYELDLHIERIVKNKRGLSNADIIEIQLSTLRHYLQLALLHRQDKMFIIHGIGKGVLRDEVHKILKATRHVERFNNEYHGLYGFGATEVFFKR